MQINTMANGHVHKDVKPRIADRRIHINWWSGTGIGKYLEEEKIRMWKSRLSDL